MNIVFCTLITQNQLPTEVFVNIIIYLDLISIIIGLFYFPLLTSTIRCYWCQSNVCQCCR